MRFIFGTTGLLGKFFLKHTRLAGIVASTSPSVVRRCDEQNEEWEQYAEAVLHNLYAKLELWGERF